VWIECRIVVLFYSPYFTIAIPLFGAVLSCLVTGFVSDIPLGRSKALGKRPAIVLRVLW
jgi:hypothetical protein